MTLLRYLLLLSLSTPVLAITNIEERRSASDQSGFSGRTELGLDAQAGNNDKRKWSAALNINWQGERHRMFAWGNRLYESSNGRRTDDDTFVHSRLVLNYRDRWAEEMFVQYERDPFAALSARSLAGAGLRYQQHINEQLRWFQGSGLFYERVSEEEPDGVQTHQFARLNLYTHLQWQLPEATLQTTLYFQPRANDLADQRALWQFAISLPLGDRTELKWQWQSRLDTRPPADTEKENHQTQVKLAIRF